MFKRITLSLLFGVFGYLFLPMYHSSFALAITQQFQSLGVGILFATIAWFSATKIIPENPHQDSRLILSLAALTASIPMTLLMSVPLNGVIRQFQFSNEKQIIVATILLFGFITAGIMFFKGYRLFTTNGDAFTAKPENWHHVLASFIFGVTALFTALPVLDGNGSSTMLVFFILLGALLGFSHGYRILLLNWSRSGFGNVLSIALSGCACAALIFTIYFVLASLHAGAFQLDNTTWQSPFQIVSELSIIVSLSMVFASILGVATSLLLYFISMSMKKA